MIKSALFWGVGVTLLADVAGLFMFADWDSPSSTLPVILFCAGLFFIGSLPSLLVAASGLDDLVGTPVAGVFALAINAIVWSGVAFLVLRPRCGSSGQTGGGGGGLGR